MTLRHTPTILFAVLLGLVPRTALACPVCFGAADTPMLQGNNMGILALLIVTLAMLGAFGLFFLHLMRRAADAARDAQAGAQPLREGRLR